MSKYFTKSVFKEALACPARLNYCNRADYANQNLSDDFLESLAEGGFQVGELAKVYYEVPKENDLTGTNCEVAQKTKELLQQENVTIAEAGFVFGNCFCRVDILRKTGDKIEIVEVKAKSWGGEKDAFLSARATGDLPAGSVRSAIREYVYDVAFQKYVVTNALKGLFPGKGFEVKAALMMADKRQLADCPHINQYFKICKDGNRTFVKCAEGVEKLRDHKHILTAFWEVDAICDKIIAGTTPEQTLVLRGRQFVPFVEEMSARYCEGRQDFAEIELSTACYGCPYYSDGKDGKKDGYDECWRRKTAESANPYEEYAKRPLLEDLWAGYAGKLKGNLIKAGKIFLDMITPADITPKSESSWTKGGLSPRMRRWVQIALATKHPERVSEQANLHDGVYLDIPGLKAEMTKWEFPLHMIDFETTAVALPFYEGMKPYENVAFQFSHHIIDSADGGRTYTIRHAGQWINVSADFPNFEFVRQLKASVGEKGTIFRYSNHENTILRHIRRQLLERKDQPDTDELVAFIESITHPTGDELRESGIKVAPPNPPRDMVDLWEVVKRFYHDPIMKGSNSIKVVLPAVLNTSKLLREKYAKPIYGNEIPSRNFTAANPKAWIVTDGNTVLNPYKLLDGISTFFPQESQEVVRRAEDSTEETESADVDGQINNGGAALWAYGLLQFCQQEPEKKEALVQALFRYCELDTLAMVFIWEYFNDMIRQDDGKVMVRGRLGKW